MIGLTFSNLESRTILEDVNWKKIPVEKHREIVLKKDFALIQHPLFFPHVLIDKSAISELDYKKLPMIYTHDLGVRFCLATVGDVVQVLRPNNKIYYRRVVEKVF